ncbi:T9SS type A sorting domain-containing protein [Pedobacter panaciterrae]|uniref:T9SS type A sorting domain-containing protein n=1 Tax=Pedobacter panaciterrae TaxID=363849 RepID=UPI002595832C|nr:T9SS type A sorting domain-containing protein [uncultured Pedobacter sp.]
MKQLINSKIKYVLVFLYLLVSGDLIAQTYIPGGTITGSPPPFSDPLGLIIGSGNTVTIAPGANVTFMDDLTVEPDAMLIINGATVYMGNDKRIILTQYSGTDFLYNGGRVEITNGGKVTSLTSAATGALWRGIECKGAPWIIGSSNSAALKIDNGTIQYAQCAYTNLDPVLNVGGGIIHAQNTLFINNIRSLYLKGGGTEITSDPDIITYTTMYIANSSFTLTSAFPYDPPDMVYGSGPIVFQSCTFTGRGAPSYSSALYTTAINVTNSGLWVDKAIGSTDGCVFTGFKNGIVATNAIDPEEKIVISNATFNCRYGINLSGCDNPLIVNNKYVGYTSIPPYDVDMEFCAIFLRNCPSYRVESNTMGYDIPSYSHNHAGIVVMNCGTANNEIYRNILGMPQTISLGIQSVGTNKSMTGTTGVKILCNDFRMGNDYNITVVKDPIPNGNNGIHNLQYIQGATQALDKSAANLFVNNTTAGPYRNYYLDPGTNNLSQFLYKYYSPVATQNPVYRTPFTVLTTNINTCPVHNTRNAQPSFPYYPLIPGSSSNYTEHLRALENEIDLIEAKVERSDRDTEELAYLMQQQSDLIKRTVAPYQDNGDIANIILTYEQVTKGAHYQLMLASAYMTAGRFDDAISTLGGIKDNYIISQEEEEQTSSLATIFATVQWLKQNNNDWTNMSDDLKATVYNAERSDPMYAGAIARSLLVEYEGRVYDPIFMTPEEKPQMNSVTTILNNKIYPSPAAKQLFVNWTGENATLMLTDIIGKVALRKEIKDGVTEIPIHKLMPGIYSAQILVNGKTVYQQKVVKR